jgi:hypothetical protein
MCQLKSRQLPRKPKAIALNRLFDVQLAVSIMDWGETQDAGE